MELKITFDVSPAVVGVVTSLCDAIDRAYLLRRAPQLLTANAPANGENLPSDASEPSDVPKPAEPAESPAEAKTEVPERPKRSRRKATPEAAPEAAPENLTQDTPADGENLPSDASEPAAASLPAEPVESPAEAKADAPSAEIAEPAPALDIDSVRAVCTKLSKKGKTKVIVDFLHAHGAESLPQLNPSHYAELVAVVEAAL